MTADQPNFEPDAAAGTLLGAAAAIVWCKAELDKGRPPRAVFSEFLARHHSNTPNRPPSPNDEEYGAHKAVTFERLLADVGHPAITAEAIVGYLMGMTAATYVYEARIAAGALVRRK